MVKTPTSNSARVACAGNMKVKYYREIRKRVNAGQAKLYNEGVIFHRESILAKKSDQSNGQLNLA